MKQRVWWSAAMVGVLLSACPQPPAEVKREVCADGVDNDENGKTDCADVDCTGKPECAPADAGTCAKCAQACTSQTFCVSKDYFHDTPLPQCEAGYCVAREEFIQVKVFLNTPGWGSLPSLPQSAITRFIKRTALDGSAVSCATMATLAADKTKATIIEDSGAVNIQGIDVTPVMNVNQGITFPLVYTQTGGDYLLWIEIWSGPRDTRTQFPTGKRYGYGCFDSPSVTVPLTAQDNCPSPAKMGGSCKMFSFTMPAPDP